MVKKLNLSKKSNSDILLKSTNITPDDQILIPSASNIICQKLNANNFKSGISLQSYPEDFPIFLRDKVSYSNRMIYLVQFAPNELSTKEIQELTQYIKKYCRSSEFYKENRKQLAYRFNTPICYILYKNIVFMIVKAGTKMSERFTFYADGKTAIMLYTDGWLFDELLYTYSLEIKGSNTYPKPKLSYPFKDGKGFTRMTFPAFVLFANGIALPLGWIIHHIFHIKDVRIGSLLGTVQDHHIDIHREERAKGHLFSDGNYMKYLKNVLFETDEEGLTLEKNLCMIVSLLPFFKGIAVNDLDLTQDISNMPLYDIISHLTLL